MAEIVQCPQCDRKLRVPDDLLGKKVKCPTCGTMFVGEAGRPESSPEAEQPWPPPRPETPSAPPPDRPSRRGRRAEDDGDDDHRPLRPPRGPRRDSVPHRGTLVLILGILSIVLFNTGIGLILGPIAWILGAKDLKEIREGTMDQAGEGLTRGGMICGIIGTIINALGIFCCISFIAFGIIMDSGGF
jgi:predicted Zn finger-like uncharacterized protein